MLVGLGYFSVGYLSADKTENTSKLTEAVKSVLTQTGTLTLADGSTYVGEIADGKPNGVGILTNDWGKYEGVFKDGEWDSSSGQFSSNSSITKNEELQQSKKTYVTGSSESTALMARLHITEDEIAKCNTYTGAALGGVFNGVTTGSLNKTSANQLSLTLTAAGWAIEYYENYSGTINKAAVQELAKGYSSQIKTMDMNNEILPNAIKCMNDFMPLAVALSNENKIDKNKINAAGHVYD